MTINRKKRRFQNKRAIESCSALGYRDDLYRSIFPYDEVCQRELDNKFVFTVSPDEIFITDTIFRDGNRPGLFIRWSRL